MSAPFRILKRAFGLGSVAPIRTFRRYPCNRDAHLILKGQQYEVKGVILDISRQGTLFRPRSEFIMKLQNVSVEFQVGEHRMHGNVVNTIPRGYGVQFHEILPEAIIDLLRADTRQDDHGNSDGSVD